MIDYFDDEEMKENNLERVQDKNHPTIWYIYEKVYLQNILIKVIKEIPFEHVQLYREIQYEDNPNIVKILDIARLQDKFILEMEYVQGILIGEYMEEVWNGHRQSSEKECLEIVLQVCNALKVCHKLGVVHRDISEKNIILKPYGENKGEHRWRAVVIDFGNVHKIKPEAVKDTTTVGTIGYAAPEQLGFSASDSATDIYALGILMCRLLTGIGREGVDKIENGMLRNIVKRCIRLEKDERYKDIDILTYDLQRAYNSFCGWQKKSNHRVADSFLQYMEEEFNIDYANTFLETPEPIKLPIYVVLMISMVIVFLLMWFVPVYIFFVGYLPYTTLVGCYFRRRLEKMRFLYPFNQNISEIYTNLGMLLCMEQIQFEQIDDYKIKIMIEEREYTAKVDNQNQVVWITANWSYFKTGIKLAFCMMEDYGRMIYIFQHVYAW